MKGLLAATGTALLVLAARATPTVLPWTTGASPPSPSVVRADRAAPSVTPTAGPASVPPSSLPPAKITCGENVRPSSRLYGGCFAEERAALAALAALDYPVKTLDVSPFGWPCGEPFPSWGSAPPACPLDFNGPTAYATFIGTDKAAALTFRVRADGSVVATVIAFRVPPTGPAPA